MAIGNKEIRIVGQTSLNKFISYLLMRETFGILLFFFLLCVFVGLVNPSFWTVSNIVNLLRSISFTCIVGVGMTLIIIHGGIDLSVGSLIGLGHMATGVFLMNQVPVPLAILLGVTTGLVFGLMNGYIITKFNIPALITTLGSLYIARGVVYVLTQGKPVYPFPDIFNAIGTKAFWGIPYSVYLMAIVLIIGYILLNQTIFGRHLFAIGGNEETAIISGVQVNQIKIIAYGICGSLAALTGVMMAARMNSSIPNAGDGWEMRVIASVIIGGTSLFGGVGSIIGTLIGASIMSVLSISMVMLNINVYWQNIVVGIILIGAVGMDQLRRSLSNRTKLSVK